jgi:hypothetical protein
LQLAAPPGPEPALRKLALHGHVWVQQSIKAPFAATATHVTDHAQEMAMIERDGAAFRVVGLAPREEWGRISGFPVGIDPQRQWWVGRSTLRDKGLELHRWDRHEPTVVLGTTAETASAPTPFANDGSLFAYGRADGAVMVVDLNRLVQRLSEDGILCD